MSDDRTQREKALILAATTNVRQEAAADVVAAAEKYLEFLNADSDAEPVTGDDSTTSWPLPLSLVTEIDEVLRAAKAYRLPADLGERINAIVKHESMPAF